MAYISILVLLGVICWTTFSFFRKWEFTFLKYITFFLCLVIIVLVFSDLIYMLFLMREKDDEGLILKKHMEIAGKYVGKYLFYSEYEEGKNKVLIIDFPENKPLPRSAVSGIIISGLESGLKTTGFSVCGVERARFSGESKSYWLTASEFDRIINSHPDAGIVISLVGLPGDLENVVFWHGENPPKLVLFGGTLKYIDKALEQKIVLAAVTFIPGISFEAAKAPPSNDLEKAFSEHFLLVTPDNVKDVRKYYPVLFK